MIDRRVGTSVAVDHRVEIVHLAGISVIGRRVAIAAAADRLVVIVVHLVVMLVVPRAARVRVVVVRVRRLALSASGRNGFRAHFLQV